MFPLNPYLKARNYLVCAWIVVLGGFLLGLLVPVVITTYIANTTSASAKQYFDLWLLLAASLAVSNCLAAILFLVRRGIGVLGAIIRWIFSAILCFVLFAVIQSTLQSYFLQNLKLFRAMFVLLWFALVIAEPIISVFRIRKLNEQYQLSLPHKETALAEQAARKKRKFNNRTPHHKNSSDSSDDDFFDYYDYYDDDAYEKRQREEEEWQDEQDRIRQEEDDYYYYQPTYSDDD